MKSIGFGLAGLGVFIALVALVLLPSTVSTEEMTTLPYTGSVIGTGRYTQTYNMPRAQLRELVFHGGGFVFLAGILLLVGGTLEERLAGAGREAAVPGPTRAQDASQPHEVPSSGSDRTESANRYAARYDFEAAQAAAIKNKEMVAWAFGAIVTIVILIFVVAQVYGPGAGQ